MKRVIYRGPQSVYSCYWNGAEQYSFPLGKPTEAPDDLAKRLLKRSDFELAPVLAPALPAPAKPAAKPESKK